MKHKKLTALVLCFTMMFSITSGIFSAAFASDSTTGSAYHLDTTTGSGVWSSTTGSAYKADNSIKLFSTKAAITSPSSMDYSGDIGKVAVFNIAEFSSFLMYNNPASFDYYGNDGELDFSDDDDGSDWDNDTYWLMNETDMDIPDMTADNLMVIVDYYWDEDTTALWYQVEAADGSSLPAKMTAGGYDWLLQDFTDPELAAGNALILSDPPVVESMVGKTVKFNQGTAILYDTINGNLMGVNGITFGNMVVNAESTDENGNVWYYVDAVDWPKDCANFHYVEATDVVVVETEEEETTSPCPICGVENCTTAHLYCDTCDIFDCGEDHPQPEPIRPAIAPVIPDEKSVTYTDDVDVSIVDGNGGAVTKLELKQGKRTSISAWSNAGDTGNESYQWQICYDTDNDLWADIQGQTGKGILISPAVVQSIIDENDENDEALIRCEITSGDTVQYSANIPVTVAQSASPAMARFALARTTSNDAVVTDAAGIETRAADTYSVVINYVFEDDTIVADPYTATLAAGSNFKATVSFPMIRGYLPYLGESGSSTISLALYITNIQENKTYTVTYKPTNVDYTVIHYWQNVDNDNFTEKERVTKQGLTGSPVPEVAKDYPGMYALLYKRPTIAADGSTVVEVYYEREYYLMMFNLGEGGYGVDPIYDRYGATIPDVGTPTRPGYTFVGWDSNSDGVTDDLPETMPVGGGRYTALWTVNDTAKVKVVIWGENPNDEEYSYLTTGELMLTPNTQYTYNGSDQLYLYCEKEEHTHDASCITCGKTEHTQHTEDCLGKCTHTEHTLACYSAGNNKLIVATKPNQITSYPTDGIYKYTTSFMGAPIPHYYLYMDGKWYCADGEWYEGGSDTAEISLNCTHTHTDDCYTCETHAHTAACYECGKEEHSHDSNCTGTVEGLNSTLWTFVESDTITVDPDGSSVINVYYDRTTFTMTFKEEGYNGDTLDTITDKWGADIKTRFETISKANTFFWSAKRDGGSPWTSFMDVMPAENRTYYADAQSGSTTITATYLGENLAGTGYETLYTVSFKGSSTISVTEEEFVDIEGFTFNDSMSSDVGDRYNGAKFYYDRHNYNIEFYNPTRLLKTDTGVPYQSPLNSYAWTPDASMAPDVYAPGSVQFEGWYLNPECTGDKFDFTTHTMPAGTKDGDTTLTLYAKWVPVTRTVTFYLDKETMDSDGKALGKRTTPHGSLIEHVDEPKNGGYTFNGWYYMDGGVEKRFLFETMVITKDMVVYAKWSSNVLKEYVVYFKIQGTDTQIADPITSSTRAGETKTFDAKGDDALYVNYREGYFPLVQSHSMTLEINTPATPGPGTNGDEWVEITNADGTKKIVQSFTFWYVQKEAVPYTVYYVAETLKDGGTSRGTIERDGKAYYIIADTKTVDDNRKAVVTEQFEPVSGYVPDAYQKRLVVDGSKGAVNEIIFYYSVDSKHAYYKITHYTQNTDGENWTEYASSEVLGDIGAPYSASPLTIDGFTYDSTVAGTVVSGELTANGLELKLYYVRNPYPYEVRYLESGTGKQLHDPKTGTGKYGQVIGENAIGIDNYTPVDPTSQTLNIRIEESSTEAKLNIITFYYEENEATIKYVVVGPDGCGEVSLASETVKVLTGDASGSIATASQNYKFVGWYDNEDCTGTALSTNAYFKPSKPGDVWVDKTYYAKFELDIADLTITKSGWNSIDENQSFIFTVTGPNGFTLDVVIHGKGSVTIKDLPIGEYTVTEKTDWSWRYTDTPDWTFVTDGNTDASGENNAVATITLGASGNVITFTNNRSKIYWLDGGTWCDNLFDGTNTTDTPSGRTKNLSIAFADIVLREETTDDDELTVQLA